MTMSREKGATLILGLIMLLLFTMVVTTAFLASGTSLKLAGNMQGRQESLAAANAGIDKMIGSNFTLAPASEEISIDMNLDDVDDYLVEIATPRCVAASVADAAPASSVTLPVLASSTWNTVWDIKATVSDQVTGANTIVHSGVRVLLSNADKEKVCP